ncbi:MAG: FlgD immunoglobulin-like domain containing protein, partial [Candidatus Latescibacterota bacterium]
YLHEARNRVHLLYQMQADNGGTAWLHNLHDHDPDYSECYDTGSWGVSPWMTGLLLEGIIKYYKITSDYIARQSILWALDYLKNNCIAGGSYGGESFVYMCGCSNPAYNDGLPDLDNMISHAFAFGYKITGSSEYQNLALDLFNTAVDHGWTGSAKHYNQQFRTSGHTVAYLAGPVSVDNAAVSAPAIELRQNYPNPFNPRTTIAYTIPRAASVKLAIYDAGGRLIRTLRQQPEAAGAHMETWDGLTSDGSIAAAGIYFVRLAAEGQAKTIKILLLK